MEQSGRRSKRSDLETVIQQLERRLEVAKQLRDILDEFPDLVSEVLGGLPTSEDAEPLPPPVSRDVEVLPNYLAIVNYFLERNNAWSEAPRIGEALGMTRGTIATVLWTTRSERFEKRPVGNAIKKKEWRIIPSLVAEARDELWMYREQKRKGA